MSMSPQTLIVRFKESPYSPWGSEIASRSRAGSRPFPTTCQHHSASVGRISAVNALIGERGLECRERLPQLVIDSHRSHLQCTDSLKDLDIKPKSHQKDQRHHIVHAPSLVSSDESDSDSEMDRRLKRGRGGRRRRARQNQHRPPIIARAIKQHQQQQQQQAISRKEAERTKTQSKSLPLGPDLSAGDSGQSDSEQEEEEEAGRHPADTALIELASFPGYDPDRPTPLPHGLVPLEQLKRVTRAQTRLTSKREGFRDSWKKLFYSSSSLAIFQDYFWWCFLHRYQAGQHPVVQDLLFARISKNYVRLLCEPIEERWRGAFFKMYPDVVAQSVYSTYIHAYPTSWNSFDDEFKTELCQFISLWQVGTKPLPNSWEKWELNLLEPPNLLKHVTEEQKSPVKETSKSPPRRGTFNLDSLIREAQKRESDTTAEKPSQGRPRASTVTSSTCTEQQKDEAEEKRQIILSDVEKALCSPSASQQKLHLSSRSSTASRKASGGQKSESKERLIKERQIKEKAREQLSSLKKIVMDKTSSQVLPQTSSTREQKQTIAQDKKLSSSSRQPSDSKQAPTKQAPKQKMVASPKPKMSVDGSQKSQQQVVGKKTNASDSKAESADKEDRKEQTWKEKAVALCAKQRKKDELMPLEGPGFEHSVFDVCGHSPLVKFFLKNKHLRHKKEHSTLVKRTEISMQPPAQAVCYRDILDQSKEFEKKNQAAFRRQYQRQRQSIAKYHQTRKESSAQHERDVEKVLSHKKETQELSNELTFHVLTNHKYSTRAAVSKAVNETLDRLEPPK